MEIVIKLPDIDIIENIIRVANWEDGSLFDMTLRSAMKDATILPKGHGRLIDADAYIDKHEECGWLDDIAVNEFNTIAPTIIEADKESEG